MFWSRIRLFSKLRFKAAFWFLILFAASSVLLFFLVSRYVANDMLRITDWLLESTVRDFTASYLTGKNTARYGQQVPFPEVPKLDLAAFQAHLPGIELLAAYRSKLEDLEFYTLFGSRGKELYEFRLGSDGRAYSRLLHPEQNLPFLRKEFEDKLQSFGSDNIYFRFRAPDGSGFESNELRKGGGGAGSGLSTITEDGRKFRVMKQPLFDGSVIEAGSSLQGIDERLTAYTRIFLLFLAGVLLFGTAAGYLIAWKLTSGIERVSDAARRIADGDLSLRVKLCHEADEVDQLVNAFNAMSENKAETVAAAAESNDNPKAGVDFIRARIMDDNASGRFGGQVHTRFPPEPNGYLHLGHAKSICLNFGVAREFGGMCNLRFDDTNPVKEDTEYVDSIREDVKWLGGEWDDREFYASNYFDKLYEYAEQLILKGKAYVDDLSADEIREYRGTLTRPGKESPCRDRSVEENLDLFRRMRAGEFADGEHVLRAKIDMASPNLVMRDPTLYRIRHAEHHRTGNKWCIYPMYDFTHCLSDSLEGITHSICTLEFENNRELYDWVLDALEVYHPQQIEFARLNLTHTVLSKRKLIQLVKEGYVKGWDDPRMPTLSGLRRRGVPPEALREFCSRIGIARSDSMVDYAVLEFCIREYLNAHTPRAMAVLDPVKVVIENYPEDQVEEFEMPWHPEDAAYGSRTVPFSRELWIERDDFRQDPPKKYHRLAPGAEVRLRYAYFITCREAVYDDAGNLVELRCTYDPESRGGQSPDGRKVKGTIHWVSARHAVPATVRLYEHLFSAENPNAMPEGQTFLDAINPDSLREVTAMLEPALAAKEVGAKVQFERVGYFCKDKDSTDERPVFNRTVGLRDSWAKQEKKNA